MFFYKALTIFQHFFRCADTSDTQQNLTETSVYLDFVKTGRQRTQIC